MFDFSKFTEEWATRYKPMAHTPERGGKNKRFFPCEGIQSIPAMLKVVPPVKSPCVLIESDIEGKAEERYLYNEYHLYFCCKDPGGATSSGVTAKREAAVHMEKFITYLKMCRDPESKHYEPGLAKLNLGEIQYYSINLFQDGWYGVQLDLINLEQLQQQVDENDYNFE